MKNKLIALLTTGMMLTSALPLTPVYAADKAQEDPIIGTVPDWVPQDFAEALQFYNTHGKSYTADGVICLVRPMKHFMTDDYKYSLSGSMTMVNTPAGAEPKKYALEIPEEPAPSDEEALEEYRAYCEKLGVYSYDYSFFESYENCKTQYVFEVELFRVLEGYDLTVTWLEKENGEFKSTEKFSFENKDGTTAETDIYSWLPDSGPEFQSFLDRYGRASVHDNYIAYCSDVNYSTGASMKMTQSGEGKIKEAMSSKCSPFQLVPLEGSSSESVILYQPTADGSVDVKWTVGREWEESVDDWTDGQYEIMDNCSVIVDHSPFRKGCTIFTFVDKDTGELIKIPEGKYTYLQKSTTGEPPYTAELFDITSNPCKVDSINAYNMNCSYTLNLDSAAGYYDAPEFTVTSETSDCIEVTCKLRFTPSGDADGDGEFLVSDVVLFQKWLLGEDVDFPDWRAMDFCRDNKLNVFDLCLMKRRFVNKTVIKPVEPDVYVTYGTPFYVAEEGLNLYLGPDESYDVIAPVPEGTSLKEMGYLKNNNNWVYTEYKGHYGWLRIYDEVNNKHTVYFEAYVDKPVIYLYPEEETDVHVELELIGSDLSTTYPRYNNGWDVTAYPDGRLLNKADGTHHRYLFWDSENSRIRFDLSKGFCVAGSDTESFLREKLTYMGLTEDEMNEFIVYWLPRMEHNAYNLITFQGEAYTDSAKLDITPQPDSLCRIFMVYTPLDEAVEIEPQQLETFERKGFAVVEWGGSEIRK